MPRFNTKNKSDNKGDNLLFSNGEDDIVFVKNSKNSISTFVKPDERQNPIKKDIRTKNIIGFWKCDDGSGTTINDYSVNSNDGTHTGGGTFWYVEKMGYTVYFNGTDHYITIPNTNPSSYIRDSFTISLWLKASNNPDDGDTTVAITIGGTIIFNWRNSNSSYQQSWSYKNSEGTLVYKKYNTTMIKDIWYNISCTFNSQTGIFNTYLNGKLETTTSSVSQLYDVTTTNIYVGSLDTNNTTNFTGYISNLRIYDIDLTDREIYKIYNSENIILNPKQVLETNLIAHWKINEGIGTYVLDNTNNNNTGVMSNMEATDWISGPNNIGYCLDFDGTNDYISHANTGTSGNVLYDLGTTSHSTFLWVKFNTLNVLQGLVTKHYDGFYKSFGLEINASNQIMFQTEHAGNNDNYTQTTATIQTGVWYHVGYTVEYGYDEANPLRGHVKLYINGVEVAGTYESNTYVETTTNTTTLQQLVNIGRRGGTYNSNYFNGNLSDVRIYNRNFSATEVKSLYDITLNLNEEFKIVKNITNVYPKETRVISSQYGLTDMDGKLITNIGPVRKDALVAHWKLDEGYGVNNFDSSGYGNNGTMTNMDSNTDWVEAPKNIGYCLDFDGSNDYINVANSGTILNVLYDIGTISHSIFLWVKFNTLSTTQGLVNKYYSATYKSFGLDINASNQLVFQTEHLGNNDSYTQTTATITQTGVWYHVGYTAEYGYDEANPLRGHIKLYINGVEVAGTYESNTYVETTSNFPAALQVTVSIGRWGGTYNSAYLNGVLSDIRIYNTFLAENEISQIYKNSINNDFKTEIRDTPIGHWKLNEGHGTTIYDYSGYRKNGTMYNMDPITDYVSGQTGNDYCLDFDGTNDYIIINNVSQNVKTISFWMYADSVVSKDIINLNGTQYIQINASSLINHVGTWTGLKEYINGVINTGSITTGTWYHIAATVTANISVSNLLIGYRTTYFDGKIYDVRLYNKTLTESEIYSIYSKTKPPSDLVAHWKLTEGTALIAHDSSVNRNKGTLTNMDAGTDWVAGPMNIGYALDFDGVNDHITIANSGTSGNVLYDLGTTSHSIFLWVKFNVLSTQQVMIGKDLNYDYRSFSFLINSLNRIVFLTEHNGNNDQYYQTTASINQTGVWYHVGYNVEYGYDSANPLRGHVKLYINGIEVAGTYADNSYVATTTNTTTLQQLVNIGRWGGTINSIYLNGVLSDIRIYKKNLTQTEIMELYTDTKNINTYIPSPKNLLDINNKINNNLLLHYTGQDNSSSTYVTDYSGNRHHAKVINATYSDTQSINAGTYSLYFDGTGDYIEADGTLNNAIAFKGLKGNQPFTFTAWVYITDTSTFRPIYSSGDPIDGNYIDIYIDSDEKIRLLSTGTNETYIIFNTALTTGTWNHITIIKDTINNSTNIHDGGFICYLGNTSIPPSINYYNSQAEINLNSNLVAHWRMNEGTGTSITDLSGYGNTGTMTNMDAGTDWVTGPYGMEYSLDFDGVNDYIAINSITNNSNYTISTGTGMTIAFWVYIRSTANQMFVIDTSSAGVNGFYINLYLNQLVITTTSQSKLTTGSISTNKWTFVTLSLDFTNNIKIYLNGIEGTYDTQNTHSDFVTSGSATARLCYSITNSQSVNGNVFDFRVYNKAFTDNEVREIYKLNHISSRIINNSLVGHWKLEEGTGTSIYDSSGNGYTGTMTNMDAGTDWVVGHNGLGYCLDFDGTNDYINGITFSTGVTNTLTFSLWCYIRTGGPYEGLIYARSGYNSSTTTATGITVAGHDTTRIGYTWNGAVGTYDWTGGPTIDYNSWMHIALVITPTEAIFYKNGVYYSTNSVSNTAIDFNNPRLGFDYNRYYDGKLSDVRIYNKSFSADEVRALYEPSIRIGKGVIGSYVENQEFNGYLDDIRLYNKKLTKQDIKGIWNNGNGSYNDYLTSTYNCLAKYDLYTGTGTTAYDKSGNNYNITLSNSALWTTNTKTGLNALNFDDTTQYTAYFTPSSNEKIITATMWICIDKLRTHTLIGSKVAGSSMANGDFSLTLEVKNGKNLVGHWVLDEGTGTTIGDSSNNSNAGTLSNGTWSSGINYKCVDFNGTSTNISIGDTTQTIKSISFWIYADDITSRSIIDLNGTEYIEINGSSLINHVGTWTGLVEYIDGKTSTAAITTGKWYHIVSTVSSSISVSNLIIGLANSNYFDGKISDVRIYDTVLTAQDVYDLYNESICEYLNLTVKINDVETTLVSTTPLDISITKNKWHHISFTYYSGNIIELYINGVKDIIKKINIRQSLNLTNGVYIGSKYINSSTKNYFDGRICDLQLYKIKLDEKTIDSIYRGLYECVLRLSGINPDLKNTYLNPTSAYNLSTKNTGYNSITLDMFGFTPSTISNGINGTDFTFNGIGRYIRLNDENYLSNTKHRVFTIMGWIKVNSSGSGTEQYLFSKYKDTGSGTTYTNVNYYKITIDEDNSTLNFTVFSNNSPITLTVNISKDTYIHFACVCKGEYNTIQTYINGILAGGKMITTINANNSRGIEIGRNFESNTSANYYNGILSDLRFYETSLTADTIQKIMNDGEGKTISANINNNTYKTSSKLSNGLIGHWELNQAEGDIVYDSSGYRNKGTLNNMDPSTDWVSGRNSIGYCLDFDGIDDKITTTGFTSGTTNTVTFSIWCNPDVINGLEGILFSRNSTTNATGIHVTNLSLTNNIARFGYNWNNDINAYQWPNGPVIEVGKWQHFVTVITSTSAIFYKNGEYISTNTISHTAINITDIIIGYDGLYSRYFNGKLSDARIYNRSLSANEVKLLYNGSYEINNKLTFKTIGDNNTGSTQHIQKFTIDNKNNTTIPLQEIARDNIVIHYDFETINGLYVKDKSTLYKPKLIYDNYKLTGSINKCSAGDSNSLTLADKHKLNRSSTSANITAGRYDNRKIKLISGSNLGKTFDISRTHNDGKTSLIQVSPSAGDKYMLDYKLNISSNNGLLNSASCISNNSFLGKRSIKLNGSSDYLTVNTNSEIFFIDNDTQFTAMISIKPNKNNSRTTEYIWTKTIDGSISSQNSCALIIDEDVIKFLFRDKNNFYNDTVLNSKHIINRNKWTHITVSKGFNKLNKNYLFMYIDGIFKTKVKLNKQLVSHWKIDTGSGTTIYDSTSENNNGTMNNMDAATDWVTGLNNTGYALDFDGVNDHITIANSGTSGNILYDLGTTSHSIFLWVKFNVLSQTQVLIGKDLNSNYRSFTFFINSVNQIGFATENAGNNDRYNQTTATITQTGIWHHVGYTVEYGYDSANPLRGHVKLYINGIEVAGTYADNSYVATTTNTTTLQQLVNIGRWGGTLNNTYLNGSLSDIRIYKTKLSAQQVGNIYIEKVSQNILKAEYKLIEGLGTTINDTSGNNNNGTLTNGNVTDNWVVGRNNKGACINLDGTNDYINVGNISSTIYSISYWIYFDSIEDNNPGTVIDLNGTQYILSTKIDNKSYIYYIGSWTGLLQYKNGLLSGSYLIPGQWNHIVSTVTSSITVSNLKIGNSGTDYFNGKISDVKLYNTILTATQVKNLYQNNNKNTIEIGRGYNGLSYQYTNAYIDEFRFYDTKLNDFEIYKLSQKETKSGPLIHYTFDKGSGTIVEDLGSEGIPLKLSTNSTYSSSSAVGDNCLSLEVSGRYAITNYPGILGSNPRTISFWFKRLNTNNISTNWNYLVDYGVSIDNKRFSIALEHDTEFLVVSTKTNDSSGNGALVYGSSIQDTYWHHCVVMLLPTYKYADGIRIYLDGKDNVKSTLNIDSEINTSKSSSLTTDWVVLGGSASTLGTKTFLGYIDDFRMYNVALTEEEIQKLYYNSNNYKRLSLA